MKSVLNFDFFFAVRAFSTIAVISTISNLAHGQLFNSDNVSDTITILNGKAKILLKKGSFEALTSKELSRLYSKEFRIGQLQYADGFSLRGNASLRFYQTSIENPKKNDSGLSTWKIIELFTSKIPQSAWIESGWKAIHTEHLYFVRLRGGKKQDQYYEFAFFNINNKLAFSVFQFQKDHLQLWKGLAEEMERNLRLVISKDEHLSRFRGF